MKSSPAILYFVFLCLMPFGLVAENWAQFRGSNGSGIIESAKPPIQFGAEENVQWKSSVPYGLSSPIVGRLYFPHRPSG